VRTLATLNDSRHLDVVAKIIESPEQWSGFLKFWARQYKYSLSNVLEIYDVDQMGTAFATIKQWNSLGRLVQAGSKGIPIYKKDQKQHVFDIRSTLGADVEIWRFDHQLEIEICDKFAKGMNVKLPQSLDSNEQFQVATSAFIMQRLPNVVDNNDAGQTLEKVQFMKNTAMALILNRCDYPLELYEPMDIPSNVSADTLAEWMLEIHSIAAEALHSIVKASKEIDRTQVKIVNQDCDKNTLTEPLFDVEDKTKQPKRLAKQEQLPLLEFMDEVEAIKMENPESYERRKIIELIVSHGSGFQEGKKRINQFMSSEHTKNEGISFLKKEYGLGGRSFNFHDGSSGYWDSSNKGIKVRHFGKAGELLLTWSDIYEGIQTAIDRDLYYQEPQTIVTSPVATFEKEESVEGLQTNTERVVEIAVKAEGVVAKGITPVNFRMPDDFDQTGGQKTKYKQNVVAIKLLKLLEIEDRHATSEEQTSLAKYAGWGGLPQAFDQDKPEWQAEYNELKNELLTDLEYKAARESTLNAHYTAKEIIDAMYQGVLRIGFNGGNILEPSMGSGNFFGRLPQELESSKLHGVELDGITGRIAQKLYPNARIEVKGYDETLIPDDLFDLAISNIPFGGFSVYDKRYKKDNFLIHDYFFQKTLDKVRPGGIIAFVTSSGTLDKQDTRVRQYIAERADLIAAIRLPNTAFKKNAGTEVTTDIIYLQRKERIDYKADPDWINVGKTDDAVPVNRYFLNNPQMLLGKMAFSESMFGDKRDTTLVPNPEQDLKDLLREAINQLPMGIYRDALRGIDNDEALVSILPAEADVKNNAYKIIEGQIYQRQNSIMILNEKQSGTVSDRIRGMCDLKDAVREVFRVQLQNQEDSILHQTQQKLNTVYDQFTKKFGFVNERANINAFEDDPDCYLLSSIEDEDRENKAWIKGAIFSKRTIGRIFEITHVDTPAEALTVSLTEKGSVDLEYMGKLCDHSPESITQELEGIIFKDPSKADKENFCLGWITASEYLSGNVRQKLVNARLESEKTNDYVINVKALEAIQPKDLLPDEIDVKLGATWIPENYIHQFTVELLDLPSYTRDKLLIAYVPQTADWVLQRTGLQMRYGDVKNTSTWGTSRADAIELIKLSLNLKQITIFDKDAEDKPVFNYKETAAAREKQDAIKDEFKSWIFREEHRSQTLVKLYNDRFNSTRLREYDGQHLTFPGMSAGIDLKPHQRSAVARILYGGNTLLAHAVGAGKTFEMVAAGMELKRLGLSQKPMYVVPNHLTEQWASEFLRLYPNANILVAGKKDFESKKRKRLMSRIATGEWDAVIVGHSSFGKIPISKDLQEKHINEQIDEVTDAIDRLKIEKTGSRTAVKRMEKLKKNLEDSLKKLLDDEKKDDTVNFEELGVDTLFIDESHEFKNLALFSKMANVAGINNTRSQKASDMFVKTRYISDMNRGRGVIFATGTPISNSMAELYTVQRYLQMDKLKEMNLEHFDAWASVFGETINSYEVAPDGSGFRTKTRFAKFYNLPELLTTFKEVADIQTAKMLKLDVPKLKYNRFEIVAAPKSDELHEFIQDLVERSDEIRAGRVKPTEDNMLKVTNDGRKAALDLRLIDPELPDHPESKLNQAISNIHKIWSETHGDKLAQLVFCDLSTPKVEGQFSVYSDIREKLIGLGVAENGIAFIHDADTDEKKSVLFDQVRTGGVRILLGSTAKMGAGTNVQDKLIALHHLDVPWRPSDVEQREGRILRQGNKNPEVQIFRYVTEGSFDSYSYQLIETKANFISQIMESGSGGERSMEDVDGQALSYAEVKAIATGNPLILEKFKVDNELKLLQLLKSKYDQSHYDMNRDLHERLPLTIKSHNATLRNLEGDLKNRIDLSGDRFKITLMNQVFTERTEAGERLKALYPILSRDEEREIGEVSGFKLLGRMDYFGQKPKFTIRGHSSYDIEASDSELGTISKIENVLKGFEHKIEQLKNSIEYSHKQVSDIKDELKKPFPHLIKLQDYQRRKAEIDTSLDLNKKDEIVPEISEETPTKNKFMTL
jgi:N12 class adenine-specific DNA methylase